MKRVAISDLHLGYDESLFSKGPEAAERFAEALADLSQGQIQELVLNGDFFEACVPKDTGHLDKDGFPPAMAEAARQVFQALEKRVIIGRVVWVPGNHDLVLASRKDKFGAFMGALADRTIVEYPVYIADNPCTVFHHGHFLDPVVLGLDNPAEYAALAATCGVSRPIVDFDNPTFDKLDRATRSFVLGVWTYNSKIKDIGWDILRRWEKEGTNCAAYQPGTRTPVVSEQVEDFIAARLQWYINMVLMDPRTPYFGRDEVYYLVLGHDHGAGQVQVTGPDGVKLHVLNTGGWVVGKTCPNPHCHVVVWPWKQEPVVTCIGL